jgi:RND family efflux transporter MFP subunit
MTMPPSSDKTSSPPLEQKRKGSGLLIAIVLIAVFVAAGGIFIRIRESAALNRETKDNSIVTVVTIKAPHGPTSEEIVLPGTVQAWHEAPIYARTNGYIKDWKTDIGTFVKAGDVLADIDTPEIDAQLNQAEADLATAAANNQLAQSTAIRWENLLKTNAVSKQDADEKISAATAGAATVASAQANVDRLKQLEGFKQVTAPFDGVVTARNTDIGALINAGNGNGLELFHIAETDKLRVYVQMPETYVHSIDPNLSAELHFAEHPGEVFPAKMINAADALDNSTRTLLIQFELDNDKNAILPGGYAEVHIKLPASVDTVRLPVNTLLFRAEGLEVATVDENGKALLKPVIISRDYGTEVEIKSGIAPDELIIVNPPDSLVTGQPVRILGKTEKEENGAKQ